MFEEGEGEVDVFGLVENGAFYLSLVDPFGTGEVDEMQLAGEPDLVVDLVALDGNGEDAVGPGGNLVERGRTHLTDEVSHHQQVQSLLFVHNVNHVYVLQSRVVQVVFLQHQHLLNPFLPCSTVRSAVPGAFCPAGRTPVRCKFP